ncbi:MAG: sigma-70 family RNA polymerase sigma factor [Chitinophagaceae bacterium]|nr:sigma-70 family RNA polymerase sigma factor [Chitinophagaceae bacterium]
MERYVKENRGNAVQAEDIYQEAFLTVWRNVQLERFSPESQADFSAYLFRVCKNKWIDVLRSKSFKSELFTDKELNREAETEYDEEEDRLIDLIKHHFDELGDSCKDLLSKFYYSKMSMREISEVKGWSEATARNSKYRCIQRLRELINRNSQ